MSLLGIDVGTTGCKAAAFAVDGWVQNDPARGDSRATDTQG